MSVKTFGSLLKARRLGLALTQRVLAARLGVSPTHLASLEKGQRKPSLRMTHRAAEILGLDAERLFFAHVAGAGFQLPHRVVSRRQKTSSGGGSPPTRRYAQRRASRPLK